MYRIRPDECASVIFAGAVFAGMFFFSFTATAADIETSVGVGMRYTDNARLVPDNEINELIVNTSVGAKIDKSSGPFQFNANTSLKYQHYTRDTFADQQYFNLDATAGWEMLKDRFDWTLQDFFSQRSINSLDPATPDNIQDTNVFTFGSNIHFPVSARQSINLQPEYRKFTYEAQNIDNQQNSLNANWNYQIFRTMNIGLSGGVNKVEYDEQAIGDNTFRNIHLIVSGRRPRSTYSASLGSTHVDRENGGNRRGVTGNLSWLLDITDYSHVRTYISSDLTDTNIGLLNASRNTENSDFSSAQSSIEILRDSVLRLTYMRDDASLKSSVWGELRKQDYELASSLGRDVQAFGVKFNYPVIASLSIGAFMRYDSTELMDVDRKDDLYSIGGNINYLFSRKLRSVINLKYQDKDSTVDTADFSEMSIFVNLVYGSGLFSR